MIEGILIYSEYLEMPTNIGILAETWVKWMNGQLSWAKNFRAEGPNFTGKHSDAIVLDWSKMKVNFVGRAE